MECIDRVKKLFHYILKENLIAILICPALFLFTCSNEINLIGLNGLIFHKICLNKYNVSICDNLKNYSNYSINIQEIVSNKLLVANIAFLLPAILAIVHFAGTADRKLSYQTPLIVSIVGSLIQTTLCLISVDFNNDIFYSIIIVSQVKMSYFKIIYCLGYKFIYKNR